MIIILAVFGMMYMMTDKDIKQRAKEYRITNHRCRYCEACYVPHMPPDAKKTYSYYECKIKDTRVYPYIFGIRTCAGSRCEWYGVDKNKLQTI